MTTIWKVELEERFAPEFNRLPPAVIEEVWVHVKLLRQFGPTLARPYVDTLKGSAFPNMKELRFGADKGVWRVAFAFDPARHAILLCAGDKVGQDKKRFYKKLIALADRRFRDHLAGLQWPRG